MYNRHDRDSIFDHHGHEVYEFAHRGVNGTGGTNTIGTPFSQPSLLDLNGNNDFLVWEFDSTRFPNGVTITGVGIVTPVAASTYSLSVIKYTSPTDGSPVIVETVATSASYTATDDGTINNPDMAAGDLLYVRIPVTVVDQLFVRVTFTID